MIDKPPPFKSFINRIPIIIPFKGRGLIKQVSGLGLKCEFHVGFWWVCIEFLWSVSERIYLVSNLWGLELKPCFTYSLSTLRAFCSKPTQIEHPETGGICNEVHPHTSSAASSFKLSSSDSKSMGCYE